METHICSKQKVSDYVALLGISRKQLIEQGINTIVRRNESGRIYGTTFIDHESRSIWNGSQLDRNLPANVLIIDGIMEINLN